MNPRRLLIAGIVFTVSFAICVYIIESLPKVYVATALIDAPRAVFPWNGYDDTQPAVPIEVLNSPNVLLPVISDLGLDKKWARIDSHSTEESLTAAEALSHLRNVLKLEPVGGTNLIKVIVASDDPKEAADIANAIVNRFQTMRQVEEDQRKERAETSRNQSNQQEKIVEEGQAALQRIKNPQSPEYLNAKLLLDQERLLLQSLRQSLTSTTPTTNLPSHIISHAQVPSEPSQPQQLLCYALVTIVSAFLAAIVASLVEVAFPLAGRIRAS